MNDRLDHVLTDRTLIGRQKNMLSGIWTDQHRLSVASTSSGSPLPAYERNVVGNHSRLSTDVGDPPEYLEDWQSGKGLASPISRPSLASTRLEDESLHRPVTPPTSVLYDAESSSSTPSAIASALKANQLEDDYEPPDELDILIAKTSSILVASSSCLASLIESREHLRRFYALDEAFDRTIRFQEDELRRKLSLSSNIDKFLHQVRKEVDDVLEFDSSAAHKRTPSFMQNLISPSVSRPDVVSKSHYFHAMPSVIEGNTSEEAPMMETAITPMVPTTEDLPAGSSLATQSKLRHSLGHSSSSPNLERARSTSPSPSVAPQASVPPSPPISTRFSPSGLYNSWFGPTPPMPSPMAAKDLLGAIASSSASSPAHNSHEPSNLSPSRPRHHRSTPADSLITPAVSKNLPTHLSPSALSTPGLSESSSLSTSPSMPSVPSRPLNLPIVAKSSLDVAHSLPSFSVSPSLTKSAWLTPTKEMISESSPFQSRPRHSALQSLSAISPSPLISLSEDLPSTPIRVRRQASLSGDWPQTPKEPSAGSKQDRSIAIREGSSARATESLTAKERLMAMMGQR